MDIMEVFTFIPVQQQIISGVAATRDMQIFSLILSFVHYIVCLTTGPQLLPNKFFTYDVHGSVHR